MTRQGVNVEVVLLAATEKPSDAVTTGVLRVVAKAATMPLDVAGLAFAMCEIAWFRLAAVFAKSRMWPGALRPSLGCACSLPAANRARLDFLAEQTIDSQASAEVWLREAVRQCSGQEEVVHA